jgi:hypothetical protein
MFESLDVSGLENWSEDGGGDSDGKVRDALVAA